MQWIAKRQGEAIPDCLYYDNYRTDRDVYHRTPLMLWIKHREGEDIP